MLFVCLSIDSCSSEKCPFLLPRVGWKRQGGHHAMRWHTGSGEHSIPANQDLLGAAAGGRTTWKPVLGARTESLHVPQRQQGQLGQVCLTEMKHKAVLLELQQVPKRGHLQLVAGNGIAPWHIPQPVLQVVLISACGHPLGRSATNCMAFLPSTSLCVLPTCYSGDSRGSQHTFYYCVDSNKVHHLHFGHGVEIVWNHEGRFSSVLWTMKNRIMHLFNNQSCVRCNNFQFLFLVYLPVFKKYSIKRKCCSKEGFNYTYLFIASARVHKTAFYALMLIKFLGTSPDTLIVFQSKWVSIKEISLGL